MAISDTLRQRIRIRANFVCEYCHSPERLSANRFTVDHTWPQSLGGSDDFENLALACRRYNERRSNFTEGLDPDTGATVSLFNPRKQVWKEHFVWADRGTVIAGTTAMGRATVDRLDMNDLRYPEADSIRATRQFWVSVGVHPPHGDIVLG
jgi:hypothetical protein